MAETPTSPPRHPLSSLTEEEFLKARDVVVKSHVPNSILFFRAISLQEPDKTDLVPFLIAEHSGTLTRETPRPRRLAKVQYDVFRDGFHEYTQSVVDLHLEEEVSRVVAQRHSKPAFTVGEFAQFQDACVKSELFKEAMAEFILPENFTVTIDPWPVGGPDPDDSPPRQMQGLVFARDTTSGNLDSNHYAYPIPIIPVMDWASKEVVRVDRLPTSVGSDGMVPRSPDRGKPRRLFANSEPAEYVPELLGKPLRQDMKPINIVQPNGASFTVDDGLIQWQKWRFRLGFTPREGPVLHDICYENRPILYRLSYSELTVPYADPRPPYHRKQAFDVGDGGFGRAANNLQLGCDCVGAIQYFDFLQAAPDGSPTKAEAVVCLHEQDNGISWKHTNFRTGRAVVARLRELVVQSVVTLANYEYVFAYKLDVAGGITVETRATGIVSVVPVEHSVATSDYGAIVAPGVLAQNHQHIFAIRIDPAIDSYDHGATAVVMEESMPRPLDPKTNPMGNHYGIERTVLGHPVGLDAEPRSNRIIRLENATKKNEISGRPVGYKFTPPATQLLLADPESVQAKRAPYTAHHVWVTGYRDGELWAAGEFTNQSKVEQGGIAAMVRRRDWFVDGAEQQKVEMNGHGSLPESSEGSLSSPVVWSVFGLTHNPRMEDWPVMPTEIHQLNLRPADFFTCNPALDVPSRKNEASVLISCCVNGTTSSSMAADTPSVHESSLSRGPGPSDTDTHKPPTQVEVNGLRTAA